MGKCRIKHYLLILNICSLHIGELSLAKGETKSRWTAFLSDSSICWFFHWHPAFGVSIFLIRKQQRAVIAHVWIQHLTSMFSYREDHPLWACKASVSLRHGAEAFICPQSGGLGHHRLPLPFLPGSLHFPEHSSGRLEYGLRGFFATRFPLLIEHGRGKNPWMSSPQLTQLEMAHLESKSIGTLFHQRTDGSREGMSLVTCHGTWESHAPGIYLHALQEWRRQSTSYHN